jgi:hypothetical protein
MTPKEKAKELVRKFKKYAYYPETEDDGLFIYEINENGKQCALIAVDEIIKVVGNNSESHIWIKVKQEIKKI